MHTHKTSHTAIKRPRKIKEAYLPQLTSPQLKQSHKLLFVLHTAKKEFHYNVSVAMTEFSISFKEPKINDGITTKTTCRLHDFSPFSTCMVHCGLVWDSLSEFESREVREHRTCTLYTIDATLTSPHSRCTVHKQPQSMEWNPLRMDQVCRGG
jgi:hypothetical protein